MPEVISCPHCRRRSCVPRALLGRTVKCPHCAAVFGAAADARMRDDDDDDDRPRSRRRGHDDDDDDDDDDDRSRRRGRRDREEEDRDDDEPARRRAAPDRGVTDTFGILSVVLGAVAGVLIPLGCCCVLTIYAAVPVAILGGALGVWGRGALRVIGLALNVLALIPAALFTVMLIVGVTLPGPLGAGRGNNPRPGMPWVKPPGR